MTDIVLFHSVIGLRPAVTAGSRRLTNAGHRVVTPDLYDGRVADSVQDGFRIREEIGTDLLITRAAEAAAGLPAGSVYAGFSMGASIAAHLAANDPRAAGALLFHNLCPSEGWNPATAVQVHVADPESGVPDGAADALGEELRGIGAEAEIFLYPGVGHLFTDQDHPDYDAPAATLAWERALDFLQRFHD